MQCVLSFDPRINSLSQCTCRGSDAIPTHILSKTNVVQAYDINSIQNQLNNAKKRLQKYALPQQLKR